MIKGDLSKLRLFSAAIADAHILHPSTGSPHPSSYTAHIFNVHIAGPDKWSRVSSCDTE